MAEIEVGFIGLGNMGGAIAERLVRSGACTVHVYDQDPARRARLAGLGTRAAISCRAVADVAPIVFTCLPDLAASEAVMFGPEGLLGGSALRFCAEMSTIGPEAMRALASRWADHGVGALDAPVSGGAAGALKGTLSIMLAGDAGVRAAFAPVLAAITPRVFVISDRPGDAQTMKLVNNLLAAANMATAFEALALGTSLGLVPEKIVEVVNASSGQSTGMDDRKTGAILARRFEGLGKIALIDKDVGLAFAMARAAGFPLDALPALTGMFRLWEQAVREGMAGEDVSALVKVVERAAGVEVRGGAGPSQTT